MIKRNILSVVLASANRVFAVFTKLHIGDLNYATAIPYETYSDSDQSWPEKYCSIIMIIINGLTYARNVGQKQRDLEWKPNQAKPARISAPSSRDRTQSRHACHSA
jgi:hypothetical protein